MTHINWDSIIDRLQVALVFFVIGVVVICTCALILFDIFIGAGTMYYMTNSNAVASFGISMATTGLLMALMFTGYQLSQNGSRTANQMGWVVGIAAFGVFALDVYFDALSADVLRYSQIIVTSDLNHNLYRALIGGLSTTGEAMAIAIIVGMPVLKTIINNTIPASYRRSQHQQPQKSYQSSSVPASIPRNQPVPRSEPVSQREPTYHPVSYRERET